MLCSPIYFDFDFDSDWNVPEEPARSCLTAIFDEIVKHGSHVSTMSPQASVLDLD